ncbi:MAG TPA: class I SAM-dependent methyltransferase [Oscillospiraceae bacterium]|nr:class I SAM-dependent methyltransferase [Oscillospiraceae bacterium]
MPITKAWDWSKNTDDYWRIPCIESAFLAERWQSEGFRNFLDLGCGLGRHTVYMGTHGLEVTAFDLSDEAVQETRNWAERENLQIEARAGNMLALPFKNDSFDCIIAYNVIYHTDTIGFQTALEEIRRILRPEGELFLTLISKKTWSFGHADKNKRIDENTILRNENETGEDIPHFFVDLKDISRFFTDFKLIRLPVEECEYNMENPNYYSVHWKIIAKVIK